MSHLRRSRNCVLFAAIFLLSAAPVAWAELRLPPVFSDHMVLQAGVDIPVWGWADPGREVSVQLAAAKVSAKADGDGKWRVKLPAMKAGAQVVQLVVSDDAGGRIQREDVLVGEVWIGSGQSNMAMTVARSANSNEFISQANLPQIRLFLVPRLAKEQPVEDVQGKWVVCSPETVPQFSAVLYQFGRNLHEKLGVPVGLIASSWGGTPIQSWMPQEAFDGSMGVAAERDRMEKIYAAKAASAPAAATRPARSRSASSRPVGNRPARLGEHLQPTRLFNGMIAPLIPYAIRGVTWYQGENNVHQQDTGYDRRMAAMVSTWRRQWGQGDWPFLFVQLAPYGGYRSPPTALPETWEQQVRALELIPNSGMAPISDLGDVKDIHPTNKHDVGKRLAMIALAKTYGHADIVYEGPLYRSHRIDGSKVRITFAGVGDGLVSRDGQPLTWFEIAGEDGKFVPAQARIEGNEVVVSAEAVGKPAAVRFAWDQTAMPNLANKEGLPATAFRTN